MNPLFPRSCLFAFTVGSLDALLFWVNPLSKRCSPFILNSPIAWVLVGQEGPHQWEMDLYRSTLVAWALKAWNQSASCVSDDNLVPNSNLTQRHCKTKYCVDATFCCWKCLVEMWGAGAFCFIFLNSPGLMTAVWRQKTFGTGRKGFLDYFLSRKYEMFFHIEVFQIWSLYLRTDVSITP